MDGVGRPCRAVTRLLPIVTMPSPYFGTQPAPPLDAAGERDLAKVLTPDRDRNQGRIFSVTVRRIPLDVGVPPVALRKRSAGKRRMDHSASSSTELSQETDADLLVYMSMRDSDAAVARGAWDEFHRRH